MKGCKGSNFKLRNGFWRLRPYTYIYYICFKGDKACAIDENLE